MPDDLAPAALRKVPPWLQHAVSLRAAWSLCALELSRLGPVHLEGPGMPFHHLGLPLEEVPLKAGMRVDGRRSHASAGRDGINVIAAGDGGEFWWDAPVDSACFYFTSAALGAALGRDIGDQAHGVRSAVSLHSPVLCRLLRALHADARAGQPHGLLVGDTIFAALAAQLVPSGALAHGPLVATIGDRRVRRALEYIHAHLAVRLDVGSIAAAAATSPFHLSRCFRSAVGCSIWQYVLRERARHASMLMRNPDLHLADVSLRAGFETYASFAAAVRREFGVPPAGLRAQIAAHGPRRRHGGGGHAPSAPAQSPV